MRGLAIMHHGGPPIKPRKRARARCLLTTASPASARAASTMSTGSSNRAAVGSKSSLEHIPGAATQARTEAMTARRLVVEGSRLGRSLTFARNGITACAQGVGKSRDFIPHKNRREEEGITSYLLTDHTRSLPDFFRRASNFTC